MPSADRVPTNTSHSRMPWHMWVVLIAGSTGSALRAVCPPNLHITPVIRRDLVIATSATGSLYQQRPTSMAPMEELAVGTEITLRPPHRTRRALLTHRAPTLDGDEEPLLRPRMQDAWEWQVTISDRLHPGPR